MENNKAGNVRGWNGNPGPQGHWIATLKDTVTIGNEAVVTYAFVYLIRRRAKANNNKRSQSDHLTTDR